VTTTEVHSRRLLTVQEAAARLAVSEKTVRRLVEAGRLRAVQPGGPRHALRIDAGSLEGER
jgi:excisionase family DNA binding protein